MPRLWEGNTTIGLCRTLLRRLIALGVAGAGVGGRFGNGEDCDRAEALGKLGLIPVVVPVDQGATVLETFQPAVEGAAQLAAFGFAVDEEGVVFLHLFAGHVVAVVPEDGFVRLDGAGGSVRDPDDSGAGRQAVDELADARFGKTDRHVGLLLAPSGGYYETPGVGRRVPAAGTPPPGVFCGKPGGNTVRQGLVHGEFLGSQQSCYLSANRFGTALPGCGTWVHGRVKG